MATNETFKGQVVLIQFLDGSQILAKVTSVRKVGATHEVTIEEVSGS